jgi:hypothetical protein
MMASVDILDAEHRRPFLGAERHGTDMHRAVALGLRALLERDLLDRDRSEGGTRRQQRGQ